MEENYILAKWLAGEMNEEELKAFQNTPEYPTYARIASFSAQLKAPDFDADAFYQKTLQRKNDRSEIIPFYRAKWFSIAAAFLILLSCGFFFNMASVTKEIAENGRKTSFYLPDQSKIVMNSGSEIEYKKWNWDENRTLNLEGEAYFNVAKGKTFEVSTIHGKVTVLGTQFNVRTRENDFEVSCYEGTVKVTRAEQEIIITKGYSVSIGTDDLVKKTIDDTEPQWLNNKIAFSQKNLRAVIEELERQYNCRIILKSKDNKQLFTGILPSDDRKAALNIVTSIFHLKITQFEKNSVTLEDF
ncbi:FecR family protein [Flavobacterium sp.]